ncbi:MAG TPA: META domain-containing protein [Paraburkholderia sp.]|uniref:META domain-containing protein n=1 Tax=Paraburkholderia sp. TaxID=1926495 RepID=UPI002B96830D|nr:META domain-containing protein [Paraburkholderia sp.]HTR06382.1 META domain-containing protein [Paraburkholderia sp.]
MRISMNLRLSLRPARRVSARLLASRAAPLAAALLVCACKLPIHTDASAPLPDPFNPAATQLLDNTHWRLVEWKRADGTQRDVPGANALAAPAGTENPDAHPITLDLSTESGQRRASGFSGCNRFFGAYILKDGLLSFGQLGSTRMACIGAGGEIEGDFLDALSHIARSGVQMRHPEALLLILQNGDRLTFAEQAAAAGSAPGAASDAKPAQ